MEVIVSLHSHLKLPLLTAQQIHDVKRWTQAEHFKNDKIILAKPVLFQFYLFQMNNDLNLLILFAAASSSFTSRPITSIVLFTTSWPLKSV
jgi:hypothetical protein